MTHSMNDGSNADNSEAVNFARSPIGGKKTSDVKARVSDDTKFTLQRKCHELGMTESEYIDRLLCISLFGIDHVNSIEQERTKKVAGLWSAGASA